MESIAKIAATLSQQQIEEHFIPMIKRLSIGDWFTSRTSACGLYAPAYSLSTAGTQEELRRYGVTKDNLRLIKLSNESLE